MSYPTSYSAGENHIGEWFGPRTSRSSFKNGGSITVHELTATIHAFVRHYTDQQLPRGADD